MYNFREIEPKWQKYWDEHETFKTDVWDFSKPKYYALDMFPYPSGQGLHVGHPEGYTATDIISRMRRMQGYNVLHPMGGMLLVFQLNNMLLKQVIIQKALPKRILQHLKDNLKCLDFLLTGAKKFLLVTQVFINGHSGFLNNFIMMD